jgi:hypothetical protein
MGIHFQPNQPIVVHLPGGDFNGVIVGPAQYPDEWIVAFREEDNPLEETLKGAEDDG